MPYAKKPSLALPKRTSPRRALLLVAAGLVLCSALFLALRHALPAASLVPSERAPPWSNLPHREFWAFPRAPDFCHALARDPRPYNKCDRDQTTQRCRDGSVRMMSQFGQDRYLYLNHFAHLKRRGVYLDVAANDATWISNSFFMDACLGWDGVCVEANPVYHDGLRRKRSCHVVPTCVSDVEGQRVSFIPARGAGGIASTNKHATKPELRSMRLLNLTCTRVATVLREKNVSLVDYMSLDVEGHELMVLRGIDWEKVRINVITVETSAETLLEIEKVLVKRGYVRHYPVINGRRETLLKEDAVFLHDTVQFGNPQ